MASFGKRDRDNPGGGLISSREPKTFTREPRFSSRQPEVGSPYRDSIGAKAYLKDYEDKLASGARGADSSSKIGGSSSISGQERSNPWQYARQQAHDAHKTAMGNMQKGGSVKNRAKWKIISIIATGGIGLGAIFGPGAIAALGVEQFSNLIDQRFGSNLHALTERRMNRIMLNRINDSRRVPGLKGLCGGPVKVACRYGGMSNRAIRNFSARTGATIHEGSGISNLLPGRSSIDSITLKSGETLSAQDFYDRLLANTPEGQELRSMMRDAMKPKIAVWFNAKMTALFHALGIDKAGGFIKENTTDKIKEKIKARQKAQLSSTQTKGLANDSTGDEAADERTRAANAAAEKSVSGLANGTSIETPSGTQPISPTSLSDATGALDNISSPAGVFSMAGKAVNILGITDMACTALNTISAVGNVAKMLGAQQLARYSATISSSRDGWKAGVATAVGFWDGLVRTFFGTDPDTGKNAFQSAGFAMLTPGNFFDPTETAQFRTGSGWPGKLLDFKNTIDHYTTLAGHSACSFVQNPITRIGGAIIGIAASIFTGGGFPATQIAGGLALGYIISTVISFIIPLAAKTIAGDLVPDDIQGQSAGNAFTSGGGVLNGLNANMQGASVMTKAQAESFDQSVVQPYLAEVQADDRAQAGLFDLGDPYSLTGSVLTGWLPYISDNALSTIMNFGSLAANPLGLIGNVLSPKASAASSTDDYYSVCTDDDYQKLDIAVDPFCNPVYGIPDNNLINMNPDDVMLWMLGKSSQMSEQYIPSSNTAGPSYAVVNTTPYIDDVGNAIGLYKDFQDNCADNIGPFSSDVNENTAGLIKNPDCRMSSGHYPSMFYEYSIDDSVNQMLDCNLDEVSGACYGDSSTETATETAPPSSSIAGQQCSDAKDCAQKVLNNPNITFVSANGKTDLENVVNKGSTPSVCASQGNIVIDPTLLDSLLQLSTKYAILINNFNKGHGCNAFQHPKGKAMDINGIKVLATGQSTAWGNLRYDNATSNAVVNQFANDFITAVGGRNGLKAGIGQNKDANGAACMAWNITATAPHYVFSDTCNHLHLDVAP